jgi:F0F1-type ATP synthase assembly protein I
MESNCKVTPRPENIKEFFTTWYFWKPFLGVVIGLILGFLYSYFFETRPVTFEFSSDTFSSMLFGALIGFFITGSPCSRFGR